jgi:hypothetical protein
VGAGDVGMILYGNFFVTIVCVYGLRAIYFALLEASQIPYAYTGTAVGIISVVGYTPDVFFAPAAGRLLDAGADGHVGVFWLSAFLFLMGAVSAWVLSRLSRPP